MIKKITTGYVVQEFNEEGELVSQEFVAGESEYENEDGETDLDYCFYAPFEMK